MGKGLPRVLRCRHSRCLHTDARQRRSHFWVPGISINIASGQLPGVTSHLINTGLVSQSNAGVYHFLPIGLRILGKIEKLLDKHMTSVGANKLSLSALSNQSLWKTSGRLDNASELFQFEDRSKTKWLLAPTHEEEITQIVKLANLTHHDQSLRLYQIGRKYRDELRPRGGLLRGKEFIMKDLYTFDPTPEQAYATYDQIRAAYRAFFDELGLPYIEARADSGNMGGSLSHEYHFPSPQGEDTVITCSACNLARNIEFVSSIDTTVKSLPQEPPTLPIEVELSSITSRDFISKDGTTLVRALLPTQGLTATQIQNVDSLINTHNLKATLKGVTDVATGINEAAAHSIFSSPAQPDQSPKKRQLFYVLDKRLSPDHLYVKLQQDHIPPDVELWAVRSTSRDLSSTSSIDLILPKDGDPCPSCTTGTLKVQNTIEIGHTFHLGTRYSQKFNLKSPPEPGSAIRGPFVEMGCHGIGVSRLFAATTLVLPRQDYTLARFPNAIAPFDVCVVSRHHKHGTEETEQTESRFANQLYDLLETSQPETTAALDVLLDDRPLVTRKKVEGAAKIGIPIVVTAVAGPVVDERSVLIISDVLGFRETAKISEVPNMVRDLLQQLSKWTILTKQS